jgi:hypothetical protein
MKCQQAVLLIHQGETNKKMAGLERPVYAGFQPARPASRMNNGC